ncbi:MAG: RhuM family protein [Thermoanaerobaculales bacterium]
MDRNTIATAGGEVVVYEAPGGEVRVDVRLERETVWLSLTQMAELFGRDKSVISRHVRNVFKSGELERRAVVARNATTAADGKTYQVEYFNLDAIVSVGYRVNSKRGTQFRIWATRTLRDHLLRGYTLNERRLRERGLSEKFIEAHAGRIGDISSYGQESNYTTWRLAKMNLAIRGMDPQIAHRNP